MEPPAEQQFSTADLEHLAVEGSTDFHNWQPLINALRLNNGRIEVTDPGKAMGTPSYMAPEQVEHPAAGIASYGF